MIGGIQATKLMSKLLKLYSWYFGIPILEAILLLLLDPFKSSTRYLGAITGIFAYVWLTFTFILTARPKRVETSLGQDSLIKFHIIMGWVITSLVFLHMVLTMMSSNADFPASAVLMSGGFIVLLLLALLFLAKKPEPGKTLAIRFNISTIIHNFTMLLTLMLWGHVFRAKTSNDFLVLKILYSVHFLIALGFWSYHKFLRRFLLQKVAYELTEIRKESQDIWSLVLTGPNDKIMAFEEGQFGYISIIQKGFPKEFHPFSFASSPRESKITIMIKELGDYTSRLGELKTGSQVLLDGPYGTFKPLQGSLEELVFIAGGVGITPFLSSLSSLKETTPNRKVTLIYGMRTQTDMILTKYFEDLKQAMPHFQYVPVLSEDDAWAGETGFIDQNCLEDHAACEDTDPSNQTKEYFICGPPIMIEKVENSLKQMQVSRKFIHSELF